MPRPRTLVEFGQKEKERFLKAISLGYSPSNAAKASGVTRVTAYNHKRSDAEFSKAWDDAYEQGTDLLEDELIRRASLGIEKGVWHQGVCVGSEIEYSDNLLSQALKARRPEKFGARLDLTNSDGSFSKAFLESFDEPEEGDEEDDIFG